MKYKFHNFQKYGIRGIEGLRMKSIHEIEKYDNGETAGKKFRQKSVLNLM